MPLQYLRHSRGTGIYVIGRFNYHSGDGWVWRLNPTGWVVRCPAAVLLRCRVSRVARERTALDGRIGWEYWTFSRVGDDGCDDDGDGGDDYDDGHELMFW